ncbi:hypothetical protein KDX40_04750 [Burkholderia ambifaria]|uniref:hypothetical protein n=1 Tax=Burkholderia ambifaria TaxID=152480 RepID=UPI001B97BB45|nr:hypothetical protein [Burkholderia ambifaria]MBR8343046.1 hypothetical protein [Burkholderia ambifaria]
MDEITKAWRNISPRMFTRMTPRQFYEAGWTAGQASLGRSTEDTLMALELIAADADAGNSKLTSGVRMALDAALIKAGRKEAPGRTGE